MMVLIIIIFKRRDKYIWVIANISKDANCLHAHAGASMGYSALKNDEIVVYKEEQMTIKYLVELR